MCTLGKCVCGGIIATIILAVRDCEWEVHWNINVSVGEVEVS